MVDATNGHRLRPRKGNDDMSESLKRVSFGDTDMGSFGTQPKNTLLGPNGVVQGDVYMSHTRGGSSSRGRGGFGRGNHKPNKRPLPFAGDDLVAKRKQFTSRFFNIKRSTSKPTTLKILPRPAFKMAIVGSKAVYTGRIVDMKFQVIKSGRGSRIVPRSVAITVAGTGDKWITISEKKPRDAVMSAIPGVDDQSELRRQFNNAFRNLRMYDLISVGDNISKNMLGDIHPVISITVQGNPGAKGGPVIPHTDNQYLGLPDKTNDNQIFVTVMANGNRPVTGILKSYRGLAPMAGSWFKIGVDGNFYILNSPYQQDCDGASSMSDGEADTLIEDIES